MASTANLPTMLADAKYDSLDPGSGGTIRVTKWTVVELTIGAGAETNTLAAPGNAGILLTIVVKTGGGGTRTITVASGGVSGANTDDIAIDTADDFVQLFSIPKASGGYYWVLQNYGGAVFS